jgi:hypothetical protein
MAPLPSWIQGEPSQFSDAYARGAQHGIALAEMRDRQRARQEQRQLQMEELAARQAERQAMAAEKAREFEGEQGLAREKMASAERIAGSRESDLKDYRKSQLDLHEAGLNLQKARLDMLRKKSEETPEALGQPEVIVDPESQTRIGLRIPNSRTSGHFQPDRAPVKEGALTDVDKAELKMVDAAEKTINAEAKAMPPTDELSLAQMRRRLANINRQRDTILNRHRTPVAMPMAAPEETPEDQGSGNIDAAIGTPRMMFSNPGDKPLSSGPVRVRRKSDGKLFNYKGDASEVPTDSYEVLQ